MFGNIAAANVARIPAGGDPLFFGMNTIHAASLHMLLELLKTGASRRQLTCAEAAHPALSWANGNEVQVFPAPG